VKHVIQLVLETDSIDWFKTIAANLSRQRKRDVSLSEAVDYVSQSHWKKTIQKMVDQKHADKVGDRLKGSKLIRPGGKGAAISVTK
jgi:hypothetical protein